MPKSINDSSDPAAGSISQPVDYSQAIIDKYFPPTRRASWQEADDVELQRELLEKSLEKKSKNDMIGLLLDLLPPLSNPLPPMTERSPVSEQLRVNALEVLNQLNISNDATNAFLDACEQESDEKVVGILRGTVDRILESKEETADDAAMDSGKPNQESDRLSERNQWTDILQNAKSVKAGDFFRKRKPTIDRAHAGEYFTLESKIGKKYVPVAVLGPYDETTQSSSEIVSSSSLAAGAGILLRVTQGECFIIDRKGTRAFLEPFPKKDIMEISDDEFQKLRVLRQYTADEVLRIIQGKVAPVELLRDS